MAENKFLEAVMDTVLDGLIIIDRNGTIKQFNTSACKIFGYSFNEVQNQNVKILMPDPYQSEHDGYLHNYHTSGDKKIIGKGREILAKRKDGSVFPMELGVNQMEMNGESLFVGTIRDISERKKAESEILSMLKKLKISNQELDQFAYIASHDLKEPLRGLANNALFLQEDYQDILDDSGVKRLDRLRFLCDRMEGLVDSLLYYSRLGRHEMAITQTNLNTAISKVVELSFAEDTEANAQILIPTPLPSIVCDSQKVSELYRNLISNGIKYNTSSHKVIELGVVSKQNPFTSDIEQQVFYVKDNGIGINEKYFEDIFKIFKRLNEENDDIRGTGVGLTYVKKIIERHNGSIWLDSSINKGSCFYFTLNLDPSK